MKIAVVNDIHAGKPLQRGYHMRAASHLVEQCLVSLFQRIINQHHPDLVVNLGDLIRSESPEQDGLLYARIIKHFNQFNVPVIHVVGNHDLRQISVCEIERYWKETGFNQKIYGENTIQGVRCIWLAMEVSNGLYHLPDNQLKWLEGVLKKETKPTLLFTHCAMDDHDVTGNFFLDTKNRSPFFLSNQKSCQKIVSHHAIIRAVFQGHLHYLHTKFIDTVPYITLPAMVENTCAPEIHNNFPEVYSIINLSDKRLQVKSYSREYCFAGLEVPI